MTDESAAQAFGRQMREIADLIERGAIDRWKTEIVYGSIDMVNRYTGERRKTHTGEQLLHITLWAPHRLAEEMQARSATPLIDAPVAPVPEEFRLANEGQGLDERGMKK